MGWSVLLQSDRQIERGAFMNYLGPQLFLPGLLDMPMAEEYRHCKIEGMSYSRNLSISCIHDHG
jgi:hypothetical protein